MSWTNRSAFRTIPSLRSYQQASDYEQKVVPIRRRTPECKPVGDRKRTGDTISRTPDGDILIETYGTVVATYRPDGTVMLNGEALAHYKTTRELVSEVLGRGIGGANNRAWIYCTDTITGIHGDYPLREQNKGEGDSVFSFNENGGMYYTNTLYPVIHKVDRKAANKVRASYPFVKYMLAMLKLRRDNPPTLDEYGAVFGWIENDTNFSGVQRKPVTINIVGRYLPKQDREELLALISDSGPDKEASWYKATLWMVFAGYRMWRSPPDIYASSGEMAKTTLNNFLFRAHPEVFVEETVTTGKVVKDNYAHLFR
jgi:hypothetical protein